jgi:hypothetical protein
MATKMSNVASTPEAENKAEAVDQEMGVTETGPRGVQCAHAPLGGMSGDAMGSVRIQIPRLKIAYGVGGLATDFNQGDLVLQVGGKDGTKYLLCPKGKAGGLGVIILSVESYWKQWVSQDDWTAGIRPTEFATEEEVKANGGITAWGPYGSNAPKPTHSPAGHIKMLIQKPDDVTAGVFGIVLDGREFCPAVWSIDKGAFKSVGGTIKSDLGFALKEVGSVGATYQLGVAVEMNPKTGKTSVTPRMRILKHHTPEVVAELRGLLAKVAQYTPDSAAEEEAPLPF